MSAGLNDVCSDAMEDVGVCRDRSLEPVDLNFRRNRCGIMTGKEGIEKGILDLAKKRWVESSPPREK